MEKANPLFISKPVADKMLSLLFVLNKGTERFKETASAVPNKTLQRIITSIAVESDQYAHELSQHLESIGLEKVPEEEACDCNELMEHIETVGTANNAESILQAWNKSENIFVKAYRDVLNEYFPYEGLRNMISYQLNGLKCAFMKMRLLNELLYPSHYASEHVSL